MCSVIEPGACCHYCGQPATTRDHIVPRSRLRHHIRWNRGMSHRDHIANLVPACAICNLVKGDLPSTCRCWKCRQAWARFGPGNTEDLLEFPIDVLFKGNQKRVSMGLSPVDSYRCAMWV